MQLCVKVRPNRRFDRVERSGQAAPAPAWVFSLRAPATEGRANEYLAKYLSGILGIPRSAIILKRGATSPVKYLEIRAEESQVLARLADACAAAP